MRKIRVCLILSILSLMFTQLVCAATENLDEMVNRKDRYTSATWDKTYLEDQKTYVWQPETLCYNDVETESEVWVLVHGPDQSCIYSKEYATNAWSFDGSTLGVWISTSSRGTNNPNSPSDTSTITNRRWLVKSDGSFLKCAEGYAHNDIPEGGFGWANTESAYYGFGSHKTQEGAGTFELCKMTVDERNRVIGAIILNTAYATNGDNSKGVSPVKKSLIKRGISADDEWLSCSARLSQDYDRSIDCYGHMRINLNKGLSPTITNYWGLNRNAYEFADHQQSNEYKAHGGGNWAYGFDHEYSHINYTSSEHIFYQLKTLGTDNDGGPKWVNWDGDSYGNNDITPISSAIYRYPNPQGFFHPYWGHPSIDRWEKYIIYGDGDPNPGTRVTRVADGKGFDGSYGFISNDLSNNAQYDGAHHAWDGWTDHVVFFPRYVGDIAVGSDAIYGRKINFNNGTLGKAYKICSTHLEYNGNYPAYPRPSQSPDGTKVAFAAMWLNSSGSYPYLSYAVAYYPHPPKISGAVRSGSYVRLSWGWDNESKYTTRGWPNEDVDAAPNPREIKAYHVWASQDTANWTEITSSGVSYGTNYLNISQPYGSTWYYAVTSEEHSGLESRTLSNVWRVTLDESGNITGSTQQRPYPADPGSISQFYTRAPVSPSNFSVTKQATQGHYLLTWVEPQDTKIRYYNIYYSSTGTPPADQRYRVASVPAGTSRYLDWCADPSANAYYRITSVDRQGNESGTSSDVQPPAAPGGISATIAE